MKKNLLVILVSSVLLAGAGCSPSAPVEQQGTMMPPETMTTSSVSDSAMMHKDGTMMMKKDMPVAAGTYETYSPEKLSLAKVGKVVLFFKASWCPTCKAVDSDILARLTTIPSATHILIVDYDASKDLRKKYGVTYQHTFVQVDATGTMIKKWSGSPTLASLVAEIK
jgi:thiol-disulfide isomerase/thioredoxin